MRTFIAIGLSRETRSAIADLTAEIPSNLGKITWVRPDRMHLTLKFLGEIKERLREPVAARLAEACGASKSFSFDLKSIGCFPGARRPRVIWVGLEGNLKPLLNLQRKIDESLAELGFEPEKRRFSPHITLGRVRGPINSGLLETVIRENEGRPLGREAVREIVFMKSVLSPQGPAYTPLARVPLSHNI